MTNKTPTTPMLQQPNAETVKAQIIRIMENKARIIIGRMDLTDSLEDCLVRPDQIESEVLEQAILRAIEAHDPPEIVREHLNLQQVICADEAIRELRIKDYRQLRQKAERQITRIHRWKE